MNYPATVKKHCKKCGRPFLWVVAFELEKDVFIPMLLCDSYFGCGTVYEPSEYGIYWWK
jgi:hypothetical protein